MQAIQKDIEKFSLDFTKTAVQIAVFMAFAGFLWIFFNDFSIAEPEGFDPLRYEYYARYGLPNAFSDSTSYRLVYILDLIYRYLPFYWGYIICIAAIGIGLRYFDRSRLVSFAIFSPISFYYLSQTGKDGIAILAIIGTAMLASTSRNIGSILFVTIITALAFFIRPAIGLIIPVAMIQFRFGTFWAIMLCLPLIIAFNLSTDLYDILNNLGALTEDEGAGGLASLLRTYTFGYEWEPIFAKMMLLLTSLFFQPFLGFLKYYFGSPIFVVFESLCFSVFLFIVIRQKLLIRFVTSSLPYVIIIGSTSPFYHFRYLAIAYPAIWAYARYSSGLGLMKTSAVYATVAAGRSEAQPRSRRHDAVPAGIG